MGYNLGNKIIAIYNSSDEVELLKVKRIKDGETTFRFIWKVDGIQTLNWFGFETIEQCVDDCITYLTITNYKV